MKHNTTLVLTEPLPAPGMRVLEARPDVRVLVLPSPTEAELAPRRRIACRFGAGYDNFDVPALTRHRIALAGLDGRLERTSVVNPEVPSP